MEPLLAAADAARMIGVTPATIRQAERRGALKAAVKTEGGIRLFRRAAVEAFARRRVRRGQHG